ncbi:MAG: hypothetical protein AAGD32_15640, partial [Planctomycetota bacterium]
SGGEGEATFRVFTHYGRTDDLENNPESGQKECRYFDNEHRAAAEYQKIYNQKTSPSKGYKEISLASVSIGSTKARGTSAGEVDAKTLEIAAEAQREKEKKAKKKPKGPPPLNLHPDVKDVVTYLYEEATHALTNTVQAKITANGIETPLGILTIGQIEKGEALLVDIAEVFGKKRLAKAKKADQLADLTGEFYSAIPHRVGRTRADVLKSVIDSAEAITAKQETLQLMRDMLSVNGEEGSVLYDAEVDQQYRSLGCELRAIEPKDKEFKKIAKHVLDSQVKIKSMKVKRIWGVKRPEEHERYDGRVGNEQLLFHGSRASNWVGILSRGILMPKLVAQMGVRRTDAGWLGHGIYFGDAACTSAFYAAPGKRRTQFLAVARVALGKSAKYKKITWGLTGPPDGHDSCHGVRGKGSEFADDEFVVYDPARQKLEYLVEFTH